jgi:hypothetical protein
LIHQDFPIISLSYVCIDLTLSLWQNTSSLLIFFCRRQFSRQRKRWLRSSVAC